MGGGVRRALLSVGASASSALPLLLWQIDVLQAHGLVLSWATAVKAKPPRKVWENVGVEEI